MSYFFTSKLDNEVKHLKKAFKKSIKSKDNPAEKMDKRLEQAINKSQYLNSK